MLFIGFCIGMAYSAWMHKLIVSRWPWQCQPAPQRQEEP